MDAPFLFHILCLDYISPFGEEMGVENRIQVFAGAVDSRIYLDFYEKWTTNPW
jgi:hypothetical protein